MVEAVALDSGPLGRLAHPARNSEIVAWLEDLLQGGIPVIIGHLARFVPALRWQEIRGYQ